jgi:hypothetical protein
VNIVAALLLSLPTSMEQPALTDISKDAPELQKEFNAASGCVRIVLIVSPG